MTWTHTTRGRALDLLLDPQPGDIDLAEIALALGNQCRFAGCVRRFYSVAEHSVLISRALERDGYPRIVQLAGLLHDSAEAHTGDLTWPVQQVLFAHHTLDDAGLVVQQRYIGMRTRIEVEVCRLVGGGLVPRMFHEDPVRTYDLRILLDERRVLLTEPPPRPWPVESELGLSPLDVVLECWTPSIAGHLFRERLFELGVDTGSPW